jgi:hypothetical protein
MADEKKATKERKSLKKSKKMESVKPLEAMANGAHYNQAKIIVR